MRWSFAAARSALLPLLVTWLLARGSHAADWPTFRHDAGRSASTDENLPAELALRWTLVLPEPRPAWPEDKRLQFDACHEPVVVGKRLFVSSNHDDSVRAYHTDTTEEEWSFFAEGPVRFAPVVHQGRVYFGSDDGAIYCLDATTGSPLWRHAPHESRLVLGNDRMISVHPARGGLVLGGDTLHFTTGVWPFEGSFLHALELTRDGSMRDARESCLENVSPQGYLALSTDRVLIPAGRAALSAYDPENGEVRSLSHGAKGFTDVDAVASGPYVFHGARVQDLEHDRRIEVDVPDPVVAGSLVYSVHAGVLRAFDLEKTLRVETKDRKGQTVVTWKLEPQWQLPNEAIVHGDRIAALRAEGTEKEPDAAYLAWLETHPLVIELRAGSRLYGHQDRTAFAIDLPPASETPRVAWTEELSDPPARMIAADGKLLVVSQSGSIHAFGSRADAEPIVRSTVAQPKRKASDDETGDARIESLRGREGFALLLGLESSTLLESLLRETELRLLVLTDDTDHANDLRTRLARRGEYGRRCAVRVGRSLLEKLPSYFANVVFVGAEAPTASPELAESVFRVLRPYGGEAWIDAENARTEILDWFGETTRSDAEIARSGSFTILRRVGAPPGAADWTREYGDEGNTLMSRDSLVRAPLGVLWYGGEAGGDQLFYNRHNWPPGLAVLDGRMFIQGPGSFAAVDIYTGRLLWRREIVDGGGGIWRRSDLTSVSGDRMGNPIFGLPAAGYHFLVTSDRVYLAYPDRCLLFDPASGKPLGEWTLEGGKEWGRIRSTGESLIVSVLEPRGEDRNPTTEEQRLPREIRCLDRHTGEPRWKYTARNGLPFISIGKGKLYCFDAHLEKLYRDKRRMNGVPEASPDKQLVALDLETGEKLWTVDAEIIATWLAFSEEHDVLIASNSEEIQAFHGSDGYRLWTKKNKAAGFGGHPENLVHKVILWKDRVIDQRGPGLAYDLRSGVDRRVKHPLSDETVAWEFTKTGHHCNYAIASEHLLTFRAAEAGFHDLANGGTGRLSGFRSGCRNSLIPAGGVLNAPNFANGCICSYSIFTSLAFVHMPQNEEWTYTAYRRPAGRVVRLGLNLGAPGDRRAADGTLWIEHPVRGDPSPSLEIATEPERPRRFRQHESRVASDELAWVAASGLRDLRRLTITLSPETPDAEALENETQASTTLYDLRLVFLEPDRLAAGERVFSVRVQGVERVAALDIVEKTGGPERGLVIQLDAIPVERELVVELVPTSGTPVLSGLELHARDDARR